MNDSYLIAYGCGIFFLFLAGVYTVLRDRFLAGGDSPQQTRPRFDPANADSAAATTLQQPIGNPGLQVHR